MFRENIGVKKLVEEINKLNRKGPVPVDICFHAVITGPVICFYSEPDFSQIKLPEPYYIAKGEIRNKHLTESGMYECFKYCWLVYPKK